MFGKVINFLSEFSIPLISGVITALYFANVNGEAYEQLLSAPIFGKDFKIFGHLFDFRFLVNDIFMVFFFGIAAVEITQSVLPKGSLNPISKAINPIFGALGGIIWPALIYLLLCHLFDRQDAVSGWGIPTATDIALAWLVSRVIFGSKHPAVSFLLLIAIIDDAIGLAIIAIFYPDPNYPVEPYWLSLILLGMVASYIFRKLKFTSIWPYVIGGGLFSWSGLILANLHPALALVFIVPFMPSDNQTEHKELFADERIDHSTLTHFEHSFKYLVDYGLFGFGLANAGVAFSQVTELTWIVFFSLLIGKGLGITLFSSIGVKLGFPLPEKMDHVSLFISGIIAALGLTVSLFIANEAFQEPALVLPAKMGALFSVFVAVIAFVLAKMFKVKKIN